MSYPILIMCYRRVAELAQVLESVKALNPTKIYFHLHTSDNEAEQMEVDKVFEFIQNYEGEKEFKYVLNPLGIYHSMKSALDWVIEKEKTFFVFEDDIVVNENSETEILAKMQELEKLHVGVLKFGQEKEKAIFWGWACTANAANQLINFDFKDISLESALHVLDKISPKTHLEGLKHLYSLCRPMAWDDEYEFILKYMNIPVLETVNECTKHIGTVSTRGANGADVSLNNRSVTFINGKQI